MFAVLVFSKGMGLGYKPLTENIKTEAGEYICLSVKKPKTKRGKRRLKKYLAPFDGLLLPPKGYDLKEINLRAYPIEDFKKLMLTRSFLSYCKKHLPDTAAVYDSKNLTNKFYVKLSEYVGRLCVIGAKTDYDLCNELLFYSGTPLIYLDEPPKDGLILNIESNKKEHNSLKTQFDLSVFEDENFILPPVMGKGFANVDSLMLAAAMYEQWGARHLSRDCAEQIESVYRRNFLDKG